MTHMVMEWNADSTNPPREIDSLSFSTFRDILNSYFINGIPDDIISKFGDALAQCVPDIIGRTNRESGHFYSSTNISSAVIRRISRESIHLTDAIDTLSLLLLEITSNPGPGAPNLEINHAENIDRPSARVLYRAWQLSSTDQRWVFTFSADPFKPIQGFEDHTVAMLPRLSKARARIFALLQERFAARVDTAISDLPPAKVKITSLTEDDVVRGIADSLVGQNYDAAYRAMLSSSGPLSSAAAANAYRMLTIVDANMGQIDDAAECIGSATSLADDPWLRAQCLYMSGLLVTKRRYDLDAALRYYQEAETLMASEDQRDERTRIESAWIINGIGLVRTLKSKSLDPKDRDDELMRIFIGEVEAYRRVASLDSTQALYLQLNLLANMTLVLEVKGDFEQAAVFWSQVFSKFRGRSTPESRRFEVSFLYRLALLVDKAGHPDQAIRYLVKSARACHAESRRFALERILYALASVQLNSGHHAEAFQTFCSGLRLASVLRYPDAMGQQMKGALTAARNDSERREVQRAAHNLSLQVEPASDLFRPSPKLPSYVTLIDLEAAPIIDLNKYLANDRSGVSIEEIAAKRSAAS